jgi:hypothetical protein
MHLDDGHQHIIGVPEILQLVLDAVAPFDPVKEVIPQAEHDDENGRQDLRVVRRLAPEYGSHERPMVIGPQM